MGDTGTPVVQRAPESDAAKTFVAIADALAERVALSHLDPNEGEAPKEKGPTRLRILR